jgi:hypothetical protein
VRTTIAMWLLAASVCAHAEWKEVARNEQFAVFQDPSTDERDGQIVRTLELKHYLVPTTFFTGSKLGSEIVDRYYDCTSNTRRRTRVDLFESGMAAGKPFDWYESPDGASQPVAPEPLGEVSLKAACDRAGGASSN